MERLRPQGAARRLCCAVPNTEHRARLGLVEAEGQRCKVHPTGGAREERAPGLQRRADWIIGYALAGRALARRPCGEPAGVGGAPRPPLGCRPDQR